MNKSAPTAMAEVASPALEKHLHIEESIAKAVPVILAKFFSSGGFISPQEPSNKNVDYSPPEEPDRRGGPGPFLSGRTLLLNRERF